MHVFVTIFVLQIFHKSSDVLLKKHYKKVTMHDYKGKSKS